MEGFNIPVVLFLFRRNDTVMRIIERIRSVKPQKVYLMSDQGRNEKERIEVENCREKVEQAIDWPCEVIKNYAEQNRGVHANIGLGAKWVLQREKWAIFLEDDNLPEISFFPYCKEMLEKYEDDERIVWVCGTNYLEDYKTRNGASYLFTQHLLPCGWASWANKFNRFYDDELDLAYDEYVLDEIQYTYGDKKLYTQQLKNIMQEKARRDKGQKFISWDYHMMLSIRANHLFGISPAKNQIKNIGVDEYSIHGGSSLDYVMTKRFCGIESYPLEFPLVHPSVVIEDHEYERKISNIILFPLKHRIRDRIVVLVKHILGVAEDTSLRGLITGKK